MKEKDCYDIQTIRNYLAAVKKDPDMEVAAYYDKNGNYVIKKLVEKKDNIFTKLNPFKKKESKTYAPYIPPKVGKSDFRNRIEVSNSSGYTVPTYNTTNQIISREDGGR